MKAGTVFPGNGAGCLALNSVCQLLVYCVVSLRLVPEQLQHSVLITVMCDRFFISLLSHFRDEEFICEVKQLVQDYIVGESLENRKELKSWEVAKGNSIKTRELVLHLFKKKHRLL